MLTIDGLSAAYGRVPALNGVSLDVGRGEIVGLIGPNGAGKSTTLSVIAGLLAPTAGAVTFEGESLLGVVPERILRRGIALVPEGRQIFGTLTVGENLRLGMTVRRDARAMQEDEQRMLDRFPALRTYYGSGAAALSGGEQQQLAIARALLARPRLLLLDEPSLGLAPIVIDRVFQTLVELRSEGVTVLLVEQNARRTIELADRTYVMRGGRIVLAGDRDTVLRDDEYSKAYLGAET